MPVVMFQVLLFFAAVFLLYGFFNYLRSPDRKLKKAKRNNEFYFVDDRDNVQHNFRFVYKGCLFEGEKYIGSVNKQFVVENINVFVTDPFELKGIHKQDIYLLEERIKEYYPHATIHWKHPINLILK